MREALSPKSRPSMRQIYHKKWLIGLKKWLIDLQRLMNRRCAEVHRSVDPSRRQIETVPNRKGESDQGCGGRDYPEVDLA